MVGIFELTLNVEIPDGHPMLSDPKMFENGSQQQKGLMDALVVALVRPQMLNEELGGEQAREAQPVVVGSTIEYVPPVRKLDSIEIRDLALDLYSDGPVKLPDNADEEDTLSRLSMWHPGVHVAERTEKDGVLLHA